MSYALLFERSRGPGSSHLPGAPQTAGGTPRCPACDRVCKPADDSPGRRASGSRWRSRRGCPEAFRDSTTPAQVASAHRNSVRLTARIERNSAALSSGTAVTTTMAASVACGSKLMSGDRNSRVATTNATVTNADTWVRAPAREFTAVWEAPPPAGKLWKKLPARLAAPNAINSRFGTGSGSSCLAKARPTAIDSVKDISAIPSAPGHRIFRSARSGSTRTGNPGRNRTGQRDTSLLSAPEIPRAAIPKTTATRGAGACGRKRFMPRRIARLAAATINVMALVSGTCCRVERTLRKKCPCRYARPAVWAPDPRR